MESISVSGELGRNIASPVYPDGENSKEVRGGEVNLKNLLCL